MKKTLNTIKDFLPLTGFLLAIILLIAFFIIGNFAYAQLIETDEDMQAYKTYYEEEEAQALLINNKYVHIPLIDYGTEQVTVHEYVTPDGSIGYQIILIKNNFIYSQGYGVEAEARTYVTQIPDDEDIK